MKCNDPKSKIVAFLLHRQSQILDPEVNQELCKCKKYNLSQIANFFNTDKWNLYMLRNKEFKF